MQPSGPTTAESPSPQAIMELASAFMRSRAFLTACELDLFTAVGRGERTSAEVAAALGTDPRGTDRLMNVLCSLGLLQKMTDGYRNTAAADRFLVQGAPEHIEGLMHWVHLWETWSTLTAAVRAGGSVVDRPIHGRGSRSQDRDEGL